MVADNQSQSQNAETSSQNAASDLIDVSYAALSSNDGFQDIIERWDNYIEILHDPPQAETLLSKVRSHIVRAKSLFSVLGPPNVVDPIFSEIQRSDVPCVALAAGDFVIEANLAAQSEWGVMSGERTSFDWLRQDSISQVRQMRAALKSGEIAKPQILTVFGLTSKDFQDRATESLAEIYSISHEHQSDAPIIIRALRQNWSDDTEAALRNSFALTKSEVAVARAFLETGNTEIIAESRGTTTATIRKQLKSIFAKTGVSNQAQLQKLLSLMSSSQRRRMRGQLADWQDPLGREVKIKDGKGRQIAFTFMGDKNGRPALLSHGSITGYVLHPVTQDRLKRAGIKLYVPCRAGFGHTDPFMDMTALEAAAHINRTLLDHLNIGPVPAIGLISGLVPLVYQAAQDPKIFSRLMVIGGCVPIFKRERLKELPINSRVLLTLQREAPHIANLAIQAGFRQVLKHGPSYMVRKIYGNCDTDRKTLRNLSTLSLMVASSKMLTVHGPRTFERELPLINYDWENDFASCGLSLTVMQGLEDPVFQPKHAKAMAGQHRDYHIIPVKNAGQLVFLQRPEQVADAIINWILQ
jgi:DNA-binding CsgD family transcriptional regulator/pimeloyl-ACP methyl ester carboxylesterase